MYSQLASTLDVEIDWTAIILGTIATLGSCFAAWASHRTSKRTKTSNGRTIGQYVETMAGEVSSTSRALEHSLEEARIVREHEVNEALLAKEQRRLEAENLEKARQRVSEEIEKLSGIVQDLSKKHQKEGES